MVKLVGDIKDDNEEVRTEELELWYRDPVDVVRELMGNPVFRDVMQYSPEQVYRDEAGTDRVVNEMWTGNWWWDMQVSLMSNRVRKKSSHDLLVSETVTSRCNNCATDPIIGQDQAVTVSRRQECLASISDHREHLERYSSSGHFTRDSSRWVLTCRKI